MEWLPRSRDEVPSAIDQLSAAVRDHFGEDSTTYEKLAALYNVACNELDAIEADEACGTLSDRDEYIQAHACGQFADAMAINRSRQ